jgi:hypothetical protein
MFIMPEEYAVSHACPDPARVTEIVTSNVPVPDTLGPCNAFGGLGFVVRRMLRRRGPKVVAANRILP